MTLDRRRLLLTGLAGTTAALLPGGALANVATSARPVRRGPPPPRPDPASLSAARIAEAGLSGAVAFWVAEADTGRPLLARAADQPLPPASVAKAVTAAYGFDWLGPGHRFATRVIGTGPVRDGVLDGDLVLAGGGAPDLATRDLAALAATLRDRGLRRVTGGFRVWAGALPHVDEIEPGQPDHLGYNPSISGLNLNYNRVHFEWRQRGADYTVRLDARDAGYNPEVGMAAMEVAGRAGPLFAHRLDPESGRELWSVARGGLGTGGTRWLPVRNSALYAGDVFRTLAGAQGIALGRPVPVDVLPGGAVLAQHDSAPLAEVAAGMLRYSTNLTAEAIGLAASARALGAVPGSLAASGDAMADWAMSDRGMGMGAASFVDHSGLGDRSRVTAADMGAGLVRMGADGALARSLRVIPLARPDGTAEPFGLRAKTGTLNFVSALAGFIDRPGAAPLVFAILTADLERRAAIPEGQEERPPGSAAWVRRSRTMQYDLVRIWAGMA